MAPYLDLIVGIQPGTTFCGVYDSIDGYYVEVPSLIPSALIVRIRRGRSVVPMQGCSYSDLFLLFPEPRPFSQCKIKLAPSTTGFPRSLTVHIEQFRIVCLVSYTVNKTEKETLDNMIITERRSKNQLANKREQPYKLVSKNAMSLSDDIARWGRPSDEALEEDKRLHRLSYYTIYEGGMILSDEL
ncbi:hypothetical protein GQ600_25714 [Phytophthora cactorum]|nr:hypothetical protein GQ600_25714 [Phytophthora cactorum]